MAPTAAYRLGEKTSDPLQMYLGDIFTVTANLAGICGLSVPCGFTQAGLPVGLQILGDAFREEKVLRVGHAYERATTWHARRPEEKCQVSSVKGAPPLTLDPRHSTEH